MRALGVDFGGSSIGLATGETESRIATPRGRLQASGRLATDAEALLDVAARNGAERIVVGVPYDPQGKLTRMMRVTQQLGARMRELGAAVDFVDESYSTMEAEGQMREQGMSMAQVKKRGDAAAACLILERWFIERDE